MDPAEPAPDAPHPLEELLARVLATHQREGAAAAERLLAQHPAEAPRLREALADLRLVDRLTEPVPGLPDAFGEFRIVGRLGEGGMGVVHLAEQTSLQRQVALKVLRPELLLFDGARERFRREIDAVARLEHPAIVPILASGTAQGVPWYAMPRLRGRSGEQLLQAFGARDPRTLHGVDLRAELLAEAPGDATDDAERWRGPWWQVVVRLLREAALGIQHAHARGVLHRDLKPSNLLLTDTGHAVVLDFGLAKARGDARLTRTGAAAGSPAYMAPELLRDEGADERTDVYGLAATLHALLGLRPPFQLTQPESLRDRILRGERQPLRGRSGAPPELLLVVETAMDVERARRHASAGAFADDLQAVLDGRPITARRLPLWVRLRRFAGRHRAVTTAAAAAVVFLVTLPTVLWWQQRAASVSLAAEVARTDAANRALAAQVERADRSMDVTIDAIERLLGSIALPKLRNLPAVQSVAAELLDDALQLFDRLADDRGHGRRVQHLRRRTLLDAANLATTLGHNDAASARLERLRTLLGDGDLPDDLRVMRARANCLRAWIDYRRGRAELARTHLAAARTELLDLATRTATDSPIGLATAQELADVAELECGLAGELGDRPGMLRAARHRLELLEGALGANAADVDLWSARLSLGANLRDADRQAEARPLLERVVADLESCTLPEVGWPVPRLLLAMGRHELASLDFDQQRWDASGASLRAALQGFDELVRDYPEDPACRRHRGRTANLLASLLSRAERHEAARPLLEQAIRDQRAVLERDPADRVATRYLAQHHRTLLVSLRQLQDWPALEAAARALGQLGGGDENTGRAARDLLRCATHAAEARRPALHDEALALLARAVDDGMRLDAADPLYAAVVSDARFQALLARSRR